MADRTTWTRLVAMLAAVVTTLVVCGVLALGALLVDVFTPGFGCLDGDEPACDLPEESGGLAAVQPSSWVLGAVAVVASVTALVTAYRLRTRAHAVTTALLCATAWAIAIALWNRVA